MEQNLSYHFQKLCKNAELSFCESKIKTRLPILAISSSQKGYIFPLCITLIYVFAGFLITPINSCLHPLSCISVIIARNEAILGLSLPQNNVPLAILSICVWGIASTLLAKIKLSTRK